MFNKKGQAAITDALLFLTIVGIVSTMTIVSAMNYGMTIVSGIQDNYETTYLDSALKTLYVVNQGRDGKHLLDTSVGDYLLTKTKEEFASLNNTISKETKISLFKTLDQIFMMFPQKSYLIAILYKGGRTDTTIDTTITEHTLFLGIKTYVGQQTRGSTIESDPVYLDCTTSAPITTLQKYLSLHNLGQKITIGSAVFYQDLLDQDVVKLDGSIYVAMWTAAIDSEYRPTDSTTTFQFMQNGKQNNTLSEDLNCHIVKQEEIYPTT